MSTKYGCFYKLFKNNFWHHVYRRRGYILSSVFSSYKTLNFPTVLFRKKEHRNGFLHLLPALALMSQELQSQVTVTDVEENVAHLLTLAQIALQKGDLDRAEAILQIGLKLCEDHKIMLAVPYMYDILITIAFVQNDVEKAETLLVNILEKLAQSGVSENDHNIVDFKLRLARTYSGASKRDLAEIGFKTCLEAQKLKILQGDVSSRTGLLYVNVLFWYSIHMVRNEQYKEAKQMLRTAYDYSNQIKGLTPYQEMDILYTLSDLNVELEDYEMALQNILSAILLGNGMSTTDLPRCYVKLARIYVKLGALEQAEKSALEGVKLAKVFSNTEVEEEAQQVIEQIKSKTTE